MQLYYIDPSRLGEDEFKLLKRQVETKLYIKESFDPMFTFNLNLTKELGDYLRVSFFANNMFRSYNHPVSKRSPGTKKDNRAIPFFYGLELSMKF